MSTLQQLNCRHLFSIDLILYVIFIFGCIEYIEILSHLAYINSYTKYFQSIIAGETSTFEFGVELEAGRAGQVAVQ